MGFDGPASRFIGLGQDLSDFNQQFGSDPAFASSWDQIQNELAQEGVTDPGDLNRAKSAMGYAYQTLVAQSDPTAPLAPILSAVQNYITAGYTAAGAAAQIFNLIDSQKNAAVPLQAAVNTFQGTVTGLMTLLTATGTAIAPGVGTMLMAGIQITTSVLGSLLPQAQETPLPDACTGASWSLDGPGAPCNGGACACAFGSGTESPPGVINSTASPNWRSFPSQTDPMDSIWYSALNTVAMAMAQGNYGTTPSSPLKWRTDKPDGGLGVGVQPCYGGCAAMNVIDIVWPEYTWMDWEAQLGYALQGVSAQEVGLPTAAALIDYLSGFFAAWKANRELLLNGLQPAADWQVLLHYTRMFNKVHDSSTGYSIPNIILVCTSTWTPPGSKTPQTNDLPCGSPYGVQNMGFDYWRNPSDAAHALTPYVLTLLNDVRNNGGSDILDFSSDPNGQLHVNTGGRKIFNISLFGNAGSSVSGGGGSGGGGGGSGGNVIIIPPGGAVKATPAPAAPAGMSAGAKVALTTAAVGVVAAGSLYAYASYEGISVRQALKRIIP